MEKKYKIQFGVGKSKYVVNHYDGQKQHKDGSAFFDIAIFKNMKDKDNFVAELKSKGYKREYKDGGGVKKKSLMSMANLVDWKGEGIKKWYIRSYPTDELGEELNDDVTFRDLMDALNNKQDVYEVMGVADSVVRERLFEYLSLVYDVDYDVVYKKWLSSNDYAQGGSTKGFNYSIGGL